MATLSFISRKDVIDFFWKVVINMNIMEDLSPPTFLAAIVCYFRLNSS